MRREIEVTCFVLPGKASCCFQLPNEVMKVAEPDSS